MSEKLYFTYNEIHQTVKTLAEEIINSPFEPELIVAIGTGGFIPARILKTYINKPILTVGLRYYDNDNKPMSEPQKIQWIDEVEKKLSGKKILLVDEVDDTRTTLAFCLRELRTHKPEEIAVAVLHTKMKKKSDHFPESIRYTFTGLELEDKWICYPWDAEDIYRHDQMK